MSDSSRPNISGMFAMEPDLPALQKAVNQQARMHEHSIKVDRSHWEKMTRLENRLNGTEALLAALQEQNIKLQQRVIILETRMALYAGLGACAGGGIVTFLVSAFRTLAGQ